jgi:hypothetical protein
MMFFVSLAFTNRDALEQFELLWCLPKGAMFHVEHGG